MKTCSIAQRIKVSIATHPVPGAIESVHAIGRIFGAPLGSLLYSHGGFLFPFLLCGSLLFIFPLAGFAIFTNPRSQQEYNNSDQTGSSEDLDHFSDVSEPLLVEEGTKTKSFKHFITNWKILLSAFPYLLSSSLVGYMSVSLSPYLLNNFGVQGNTVGFYFLINTIATSTSCAITGKLTEIGYGVILYSSVPLLLNIAFFALFLPLFFPVLINLGYFLPFCAMYGVAYAVACVSAFLVCEKVAVREKFVDIAKTKQFVATLWGLTFSCGRLFGSFVFGGAVLDMLGFYWTNLVVSIVSLVLAVINIAGLCKLNVFDDPYYYDQINL